MSEIVFRVDSSMQIGIGHVMRCLTLADALRQQGVNSLFICRDLPGQRTDLIAHRGYQHHLLSPVKTVCDPDPKLGTWLATGWQQDAQECQQVLSGYSPMALVVDHYGLDIQWEHALLCALPGCPLLVIDDLANRSHLAHALLDQTLDRQASAYHPLLIPSGCALWLGSAYTLLRKEFSAPPIRRRIPQDGEPWRILVSLGGTDPENLTLEILRALHSFAECMAETKICVVMGKTAPHLASITEWCQHHELQLVIDCDKMAAQLDWAHVAIGAGGTSASERCARGLPSLLLVMADNQQLVSESLAAYGAAINLGPCSPFPASQLRDELVQLLTSNEIYEQMVACCYQAFDGAGAHKVASALLRLVTEQDVRLLPMSSQDCELLWHWQCEPGIRHYFRNPAPPSWQEHQIWFASALANPKVQLFRIEHEGCAVGMLRLDSKGEDAAEISLLLSSRYQGKGIAARALRLVQERNPELCLLAEVHPENQASKRLFIAAGFQPLDTTHYQFITAKKREH